MNYVWNGPAAVTLHLEDGPLVIEVGEQVPQKEELRPWAEAACQPGEAPPAAKKTVTTPPTSEDKEEEEDS